MPQWALAEARDHSKQMFNQELRVAGVSKPTAAIRAAAAAVPADVVPPKAAGMPTRVRRRGKMGPPGLKVPARKPE